MYIYGNVFVIGKSTLLPFQKGILQSINALKLLYADLRERHGIKYILTYRLNQDVIENFFNIIRSKSHNHEHPDREEFRYRLRSYILGKNEGSFTEGGNVLPDDTPDLEPSCPTLTGQKGGISTKYFVINIIFLVSKQATFSKP